MLKFSGERIVPEADNCEPLFALKMYQEHIARYLFAAQVCSGKRVLDVGCGVGYGSHLLARRGAAQVVAFDLSEQAVGHGRDFYAHRNVQRLVASAEEFAFSQRFDVVVCFELIEHIQRQHRAVERMAGALADDGILIISTPRPTGPKRSAFHTRELAFADLSGLLETYFPHVHFFFENNHFASLIASAQPSILPAIHAMHPQFNLGQADYFIALASHAPVDVTRFQPQLVLNNDDYVRNLERDVEILHRAEDDLKVQMAASVEQQAAWKAHTDEESGRRAAELSALQAQLAEQSAHCAAELAALRERLSQEAHRHEVEVAGLNSRVQEQSARHETEIVSLRTECAQEIERRDAEITHLQKTLGEAVARQQGENSGAKAQLADEIERRDAEIARLQRQLGEEAARHSAEMGALRGRHEVASTESVALRRHSDELLAKLEIADRHLAEMSAWCSSNQQEAALWRQAATDQHALVGTLRTHLDNLYQSGSWRITAPLRRALDLMLAARGWTHIHGGSKRNGALPPPLLGPIPLPEAAPGRSVPTRALPMADNGLAAARPAGVFRGKSRFDVLYVIACHEGESKRYRAHNLAVGLQELGFESAAILDSDTGELLQSGVSVQVLVLFRSGDTPAARQLIQWCRERGTRVCFDVDDLVFEPDSAHLVRVVSTFSAPERAEYVRGVEQYRRMLLESDFATCPTAFLAGRIELLGKPAAVIPNSLNRIQSEAAERLLPRAARDDGAIRLGYFSGSNTHQVDFQACEPALLSVMERHPQCRFVLGGILDLGPQWDAYGDRIERLPYMPYDQMLAAVAGVDINLAPLEIGNPYCEGKSQLKIFEAGLVCVPTIASATSSYRAAIDHGTDGFLAANETEWGDAFEALLADSELRESMGRRARERALSQFGPQAAAKAAAMAYGLTPRVEAPQPEVVPHDSIAAEPVRLKISWIVPGLIIGGGGHRNILRAAYHLERFGHQLELYFTNTDLTETQLAEAVRTHFYPLQCPMHRYQGAIRPTDVLFATHWSTVDAAVRARNVAGELMYFVQDFEPAFAPMGTEYVLAENTYRLGLYHITSGPWCEHVLKGQFHCDADHFVFPIDADIYRPRTRVKPNKNILFFAKPEMPRRCFELGLMALEHFHRIRPDVEIILFGSRNVEDKRLPFPVTVRSLLPTIQDLAELYANADLGMVFSTTNPSLVPYEMMACGLPVVDLGRPGNEINYAGRQDIALLADPAPATMARQIADLLANPDDLAARSRNGLDFVKTFPSEEQMARRVESLILKRLAGKTTSGYHNRAVAQATGL